MKKIILFIAINLFSLQNFAQTKTINGKVSNEDGVLAGATVKVVGTNNAVSTGFDGVYSIKANVGDVLEASFIGLVTKTKTVGERNVINFSLFSNKKTNWNANKNSIY